MVLEKDGIVQLKVLIFKFMHITEMAPHMVQKVIPKAETHQNLLQGLMLTNQLLEYHITEV